MKNSELSVKVESIPGLKSKFDVIRPVWTTKEKSLTFPNRALTLRQIADRFASGLNTLDEKIALYDDGKVIIKDFNKLDLTERMEIVRDAETRMQQIIHDRQVAAKAKKEHEFTTLVQSEVDKRLKDIAEKRLPDNA